MTANWKKRINDLWLHIGNKKFYNAENDAAFKKLFVDNPDLLKQFISDVLHIPINEIEDMVILNPEFPPEEPAGKSCRLDISIRIRGKKINIEMQAAREEDFGDRALFYWAEMHISSVERGTEYGEVPKTIAVNILGFRYFEWEKYHSCFKVMEVEKHAALTDKMEIHFFELPKLVEFLEKNENKNRQMSNEELWLRMLSARRKEEFEMIASANNPYVNESIVQLLTMNTDEKFRDHMRERDKWERDYLAGLSKAERKGREKGRAEGEAIGLEKGEAIGLEKGKAIGLEKGKAIGLEKGEAIGLEKGEAIGLEKGKAIGLEKGKAEAIEEMRISLKEEGFDDAAIERIINRKKK